MSSREDVRRRARESIARGDATGWFERLYRDAAGQWDRIPWADLAANPHLVAWLDRERPCAPGRRCLVVGCGLGDDAEALAAAGFDVVAFDVARSAIEACTARFPNGRARYEVADVLAPPPAWRDHFDLVVESYTLQVLPPDARRRAIAGLASLLAPGGRLLVICRAREAHDPEGELPWPLTRDELAGLVAAGLQALRVEDFLDDESPPVRRFRALYERPRTEVLT